MAKRLLQHATFTGAATKKARLLQKEAADTAAVFLSNSKPTLMKVEPWDASDFPFSGCNGSHDLSAAPSAGAVRRDHGNNRRASGNSHQEFTTVPYYDGREWRKYGEKNISGLNFPRCYYRCTYSPCPAKKRVEQISHDYPPMYLVTYEKEHTCNVSSVGTNSLPPAAAPATAPKTDIAFLPSATQVHESIVVEQKHSPSTPSTISDGSLGETCSLLDQSTLPELSTLESMEMVNYHELTSFLPYSSPDLPILSDLPELESMETANPPILSDFLELESMETENRQESSIPRSSGAESPSPSYFPDLAALESMITAANFDTLDLDLAGAGDMHGFLALDNLVFDDPACFDSSYLDVLDPLLFDDVDSLNPLWSWS